jgi:hypothetical protein
VLYLSMEESSNTAITLAIVPTGETALMKLEMRKVLLAESRADEVAIVTPAKAPELMATFNRGYLDASNLFAKAKLEQARAEDSVNQIRAEILIDKVPALLKEKGLSTSADIRQALVEADPEYQEARERLARLDAMVEYLKGKMKFLENAYTSVKKIMDTGNWQMQLRGGRSELSGGVSETAPVGSSKFGNPR